MYIKNKSKEHQKKKKKKARQSGVLFINVYNFLTAYSLSSLVASS